MEEEYAEVTFWLRAIPVGGGVLDAPRNGIHVEAVGGDAHHQPGNGIAAARFRGRAMPAPTKPKTHIIKNNKKYKGVPS